MADSIRAFDPFRALRVLSDHCVDFVVVGGFAGRAWGSPTHTNDLHICYERSPANFENLAGALRELEATLRGAPAGLPFLLDAQTIRAGDAFTFETSAGALDCLGTPSGTKGYPELARNASAIDVDGVRVLVTSLDDLMRMKRAAARPKDLVELEVLAALKEERERQPPESD